MIEESNHLRYEQKFNISRTKTTFYLCHRNIIHLIFFLYAAKKTESIVIDKMRKICCKNVLSFTKNSAIGDIHYQ